jgi:tetratricopeptide (TPR) repeat protein
LKTALFFSPFSNAQAYFTLGQIYEAQGRDEAAKQAYSRAIPPKIIPQNYDVVVYGRGARHPILIPQLLDPGQGESDAEPWLTLLRLYRTTGETGKAEHVLEQLQLRFPYLSGLPAGQ